MRTFKDAAQALCWVKQRLAVKSPSETKIVPVAICSAATGSFPTCQPVPDKTNSPVLRISLAAINGMVSRNIPAVDLVVAEARAD